MKGCPDCDNETKRGYELQEADMYLRRVNKEWATQEELLRQQEALNKMQKAIDYYNIRK